MQKFFSFNLLRTAIFKLFFLVLILISCSGSTSDDANKDSGDPVDIIPSNLSLSVVLRGADNNSPNGDGSGVVELTASAKNAVSYSLRFGTGDSKTSSSGKVDYTYTELGTKTYDVKILAYSSTDNYISIDKQITVYVKPDSEQGLLELLAGDSSKTWKINAAQDAHFSNGEGDKKYSTFWEAAAFSKSNAGFYDDEYIFNINGTYKHKTNGDIFGKANYLINDFGSTSQSANSDGEIEKYTLSDYDTAFEAKIVSGENKLKITGKGFIGFYIGEHNYTIE